MPRPDERRNEGEAATPVPLERRRERLATYTCIKWVEQRTGLPGLLPCRGLCAALQRSSRGGTQDNFLGPL